MAYVAQTLTQEPIYKPSSISYFKHILLSTHNLILLIYGDNTCPPGFGNDNSKTTSPLHLPVDASLKRTTTAMEETMSLQLAPLRM